MGTHSPFLLRSRAPVSRWGPKRTRFHVTPREESPGGAQIRRGRRWAARLVFFGLSKKGHGTPPVDPSPAHFVFARLFARKREQGQAVVPVRGPKGGLSVRHRRAEVQKIKARNQILNYSRNFGDRCLPELAFVESEIAV